MEDLRPRLEQALAGVYAFERELGGGGMSRTYLVREVALDRRAVVKVLAPELLAGISVERFRREVLLAAKLQHPHVVPVLASGEVDGLPWFTMPYIDGDSLRDRLGREPLGIGEIVSILRDVARALAYAHDQRIIHRDIKPDNVLLSRGSATVTDFGIAKAISAARTGGNAGQTLTQVGTSIGTPAYMAPEQAAGDPGTDHRADLYSFGVMAYEMLAGRPPFVATSPTKLLAAHMSETPRNVLTERPDCPEALADLVMRCLAKDPEDRPQRATDLARVLDTVTTSGSGGVVPEILRGGTIRLGRALALWVVATLLVIITAWAAREVIGLPDWVLPGAAGVMLAGLPVLLFTAYVQRTTHRAFTATPNRTPAPQGTMATLAMKASPHISWRRTWFGGALAVGGFAVLVIGFMVLRALGIGPMGSLRGSGAFGENEPLMVADFVSPPSDSTLGATAAEALRTDLAQSSSLEILTRSTIRDALTLMERPVNQPVLYDVAREIATREGAKAVLDGDIKQIGQSYIISARLVSALDGSDLAVFREDAATQDGILEALGRLGKQIRSKAGESLKDIRASSELERVTTPSLPALRKYVEGSRLADEQGEMERGMGLLREAVQLDTAFAMAWRKLAVLLNNEGRDRQALLDAISTAYRHRDRLTETERLLTEGFYFTRGPSPDPERAIRAYEEAARLDTLNTSALNNAAVVLGELRQYARAESLYRRVVRLPRTFGGAFTNLLIAQINTGHIADVDSTVARFRATFPSSNDIWEAEWYAAWAKADYALADSISRAVGADSHTLRQAIQAGRKTAVVNSLRGRMRDALAAAVRGDEALYRAQPTVGNLLEFALDTTFFNLAMERNAEAFTALDRGLARAPTEKIPPSERPWGALRDAGLLTRNPDLARRALQGFDRDLAAMSDDAAGERAGYQAAVSYAEGRWRDAITELHAAEDAYQVLPKVGGFYRGMAWRELGRPDSAIAELERSRATPDPFGFNQAQYQPRTLLMLGELYEAQGDTARAIERYSEFTELWKDADAPLQPRVREIRGRIARLQAAKG
jgi:tetratricopeptide (TPR) repeat protein/tRNA A-37 threonylcarbamoyl transferase component Bud32